MARLLRVVSLTLLIVVLVGGAGSVAIVVVARLHAHLPALAPEVTTTASWAAGPTTPASIAVPEDGSFALAAVFGGTVTPLASSNAQMVRPIASVAKTMTALAILDARPLPPGEAGPSLIMSQQDVDDYRTIAAEGGSVAPVALGERLTERDLLLGLMLPSANNLALTAARWVDGSVSSFVHRLNARAAALGMLHTHFADPDGLDIATTSTAADLVTLGETVVNDDALLSIVSTTAATLPDGTEVQNLDILLGQDPGWVGVKTGWTPTAGGCLLFAAKRVLGAGTPPLAMVGAVLGQPPDGGVDPAHPELGTAFDVARTSVDSAYASFATARVAPETIPVTGQVAGSWGTYSALRMTGPTTFVLLHTGDHLSVVTTVAAVEPPAAAGTRAGSVTVSLGTARLGTWTLTTASSLSGPSPWWRLLSG